jgi:hypothetical protein
LFEAKAAIFETKCDSLVDETIEQIKQKEQNLIEDITKYSKNLQNQAEFERKTVKTQLSDLDRGLNCYSTFPPFLSAHPIFLGELFQWVQSYAFCV